MLTPSDRDRLLHHLGLDEPPSADLEGLRAVHRAFAARVPFESIAVQLGELAPIDAAALVERIVAGGRGGYCFEANTVLFELLTSLGFAVERREAVVGPRSAFAEGAPTNHLALVVTTADGDELLAEGGFGEGPMEPLALREGRQRSGAFEVGFERDGDGWWFAQHEHGSTPGFRFGDEAAELDAFAPHHRRLSTSPESGFVRRLIVQRPAQDRIVALRARTLTETGPAATAPRTVLDDVDALAGALDERFGIDPAKLGAARLDRLWVRAREQHEAHLAAQISAD